MKVQVRLFARYREAAGRERLELDLPEGGTVETAWAAVVRHASRARPVPALHPVRRRQRLRRAPITGSRDGDELCLLPPGERRRAAASDWIEVVDRAALRATRSPQAVDDPGRRRRRDLLGRRAQPDRRAAGEVPRVRGARADGRGQDAGDRRRPSARAGRACNRVAMLHRIGRLEIGESSVMIAVSVAAPRRGLRGLPLRHRHVGVDVLHAWDAQ